MGISIWQLVIILGIVILLFGTKKLRNVGGDLGSAIKSFKKAVKDGENDKPTEQIAQKEDGRVIDAEVTKEKDEKKS